MTTDNMVEVQVDKFNSIPNTNKVSNRKNGTVKRLIDNPFNHTGKCNLTRPDTSNSMDKR